MKNSIFCLKLKKTRAVLVLLLILLNTLILSCSGILKISNKTNSKIQKNSIYLEYVSKLPKDIIDFRYRSEEDIEAIMDFVNKCFIEYYNKNKNEFIDSWSKDWLSFDDEKDKLAIELYYKIKNKIYEYVIKDQENISTIEGFYPFSLLFYALKELNYSNLNILEGHKKMNDENAIDFSDVLKLPEIKYYKNYMIGETLDCYKNVETLVGIEFNKQNIIKRFGLGLNNTVQEIREKVDYIKNVLIDIDGDGLMEYVLDDAIYTIHNNKVNRLSFKEDDISVDYSTINKYLQDYTVLEINDNNGWDITYVYYKLENGNLIIDEKLVFNNENGKVYSIDDASYVVHEYLLDGLLVTENISLNKAKDIISDRENRKNSNKAIVFYTLRKNIGIDE